MREGRLTQVKVVHAVSHQDVVEEHQARVVNALIEPVGSVCSVYVLFCKDKVADEKLFSFLVTNDHFSHQSDSGSLSVWSFSSLVRRSLTSTGASF